MNFFALHQIMFCWIRTLYHVRNSIEPRYSPSGSRIQEWLGPVENPLTVVENVQYNTAETFLLPEVVPDCHRFVLFVRNKLCGQWVICGKCPCFCLARYETASHLSPEFLGCLTLNWCHISNLRQANLRQMTESMFSVHNEPARGKND